MYVLLSKRKKSTQLGENWDRGVPIEVIPLAYKPIMNTLAMRFGGEPILRMAKSKAVSSIKGTISSQSTGHGIVVLVLN